MSDDLSKLTASGCQKTAAGQAKKMLGYAKGGKVNKPKKNAGPAAADLKTQPRPAPGPLKRAMGGAGKVRKGVANRDGSPKAAKRGK